MARKKKEETQDIVIKEQPIVVDQEQLVRIPTFQEVVCDTDKIEQDFNNIKRCY